MIFSTINLALALLFTALLIVGVPETVSDFKTKHPERLTHGGMLVVMLYLAIYLGVPPLQATGHFVASFF